MTPPLDHGRGQGSLHAFSEQLDEFHDARRQSTFDREASRLFTEWHSELRAQDQVARGRAVPLKYIVEEIDGRRVRMRLDREPEEDLLEQERVAESDDGRRRVSGVVEGLDGDRLVLYLDRQVDPIPKRGRLLVNARLTLSAIQRQREALVAVQHGDAGVERPELRELLVRPDLAQPPVPEGDVEWLLPHLDDDKKDAVRRALWGNDFVLVEGPPGTGKTTFIAELVGQTLRANPMARILVTSQTHVALDNALEGIASLLPESRLIRLARSGDPRVSKGVETLLVDEQMARWVRSVRRKSEIFLKEWAQENGADLEATRVALALTELIAVKRQMARLQEDSHSIREQLHADEETVDTATGEDRALTGDERNELEEELRDYRDRRAELRREVERLIPLVRVSLKMPVESLTKASVQELEALVPRVVGATGTTAKQFERLVRLQGDWLERVGRGSQFHAALLYATQVVAGTCVGLAGFRGMREVPFDLCILDEASKATATEALVPLSRAQKWVLVGDRRQLPPFQDDALSDAAILDEFELDATELVRTLFDRMSDGLPEASKTMLRTQHRMVRPIGDLVSDRFYEAQLSSDTHEEHPDLRRALEAPATWVDTSGLPRRSERSVGVEGKSFVNRVEASVIAARLSV